MAAAASSSSSVGVRCELQAADSVLSHSNAHPAEDGEHGPGHAQHHDHQHDRDDEKTLKCGSAAQHIQSTLETGVQLHHQLLDHVQALLDEHSEAADECAGLFYQIRELLHEMHKTCRFYPDKTTFEREYRNWRAQQPSHVALNVAFSFTIGHFTIDLYKLYFEVLARGGFVKVNEEGSWHQVWDWIGDRGIEPRDPLSYEDENTLRNLFLDYLYPFECYNRQQLDAHCGVRILRRKK